MSSTRPSGQLDVDTLRQAIESRDANAVLALYAPDAEIISVDQEHPPSNPRQARGIDQIREAFEDVYSRDMTHELTQVVAGPDGIAYTVACQYPDGTRVRSNAMLQTRDGRIVRHEEIVAWDAA